MEAKFIMQVVRQIPGRLIFNEVKLLLDSMPCNILEELALVLNKRCPKLRIHFSQMTGSNLTPLPCVRALMILQKLSNVTFLNVSATAKLHVDRNSQTPVQELQSNLPIFQFLTKITWSTDTELLLCVIQRAPKLQLLEIGYTSWYSGRLQPIKPRNLPEILESLPQNATLHTELRIYYDGEQATEELLTRMCNFPNKISMLTLNCHWYYGNPKLANRAKPKLWNPIILQFLASQSGSLQTLYIDGTKEFDLPELDYLENLTIQSTFPDSGFNPAKFSRLKEVSISSNEEVVKLFTPHIWGNVTCLEITSYNAQNNETIFGNEIFSQLGTCFPKLEELSISPDLFLKFIRFFRHNYFPVNEFLIWDHFHMDTDEIWFELTGTRETMNENDLWTSTFLTTDSGLRGFGACDNLRELKFYQCPIKILHALVMSSRLGNLTLHKLEVGIILEPLEYRKYWKILSKYHDIVILRKPFHYDDDEYRISELFGFLTNFGLS